MPSNLAPFTDLLSTGFCPMAPFAAGSPVGAESLGRTSSAQLLGLAGVAGVEDSVATVVDAVTGCPLVASAAAGPDPLTSGVTPAAGTEATLTAPSCRCTYPDKKERFDGNPAIVVNRNTRRVCNKTC